MRSLLNIIIFTHNCEDQIKEIIDNGRLLSSDIIIIDTESQDKTKEIAEKTGLKVYSFPNQKYVEPARAFGIKKAESDWVLILDSDERLTQELIEEIKPVINHPEADFSYYMIPRKNFFLDQWLKHGGWWPDYQIRLINKNYFLFWPKEIHSTPKIKGKGGILKNYLLHYSHGNINSMVEKTLIFEDIESDLLYQASRSVNTLTFFRKFLGELWRRLIIKKGFFDGKAGIIESVYQAYSKTITYLFLYEKNLKKSRSLHPLS